MSVNDVVTSGSPGQRINRRHALHATIVNGMRNGRLRNNMSECKAETVANELRCSKYFVAAIGCRNVGHDELVEIVKIIRSRDTKSMRDKLSHLYKYHPSTISMNKYSASNCPSYEEGLCDCFMPDIKRDDCYCERKKRYIREETDYRGTADYKFWRTAVFERDKYTCQDCGVVGGELNAHHVKKFKDYPKDRYDIKNGITLCVTCHRKRHSDEKQH